MSRVIQYGGHATWCAPASRWRRCSNDSEFFSLASSCDSCFIARNVECAETLDGYVVFDGNIYADGVFVLF